MAFEQNPGETLVQMWDRWKALLRSCPTHGQPAYVLQHTIYNAMDTATMERINTYTGYRYLELPPAEAQRTIERLVEFDRSYGVRVVADTRPPPSMKLYDPSKAPVDPEVQAQFYMDQMKKMKKQVQFLSRGMDH